MNALARSISAAGFGGTNPNRLVVRPAPLPVAFPVDLAGRTARALAKVMCRSGMAALGEDDLCQEMLLEALRRWHHFDPDTASASTFISIVMRNVASSLFRSATAQKRQPRVAGVRRNVFSFDHTIDWPRIDPQQINVDLRMDIEELMEGLPIDLQATCQLLRGGSVADAARTLGVPRHRIVGLIQEVRQVFERVGLGPFRGGRRPCQKS